MIIFDHIIIIIIIIIIICIAFSVDHAAIADYAPEEEVRLILSKYLSGLTFDECDDFGLRLPAEAIPEGFHLIHKRSSRRTLYTTSEGYAIIISKESSWRSDISNVDSTESVWAPPSAGQNDSFVCMDIIIIPIGLNFL